MVLRPGSGTAAGQRSEGVLSRSASQASQVVVWTLSVRGPKRGEREDIFEIFEFCSRPAQYSTLLEYYPYRVSDVHARRVSAALDLAHASELCSLWRGLQRQTGQCIWTYPGPADSACASFPPSTARLIVPFATQLLATSMMETHGSHRTRSQ